MKSKLFSSAMLIGSLAFGALTLTGCATTIKLEVERPPTLNTAGIKRIAIMPFESTTQSSGSIEMAQYITTTATSRIRAMNHFTLVDPGEVDRLRRSGQSIENHVDAILTGKVTRTAVSDDSRQGQTTNKDGQTVHFTTYMRSVEIEFEYSLMRARDASLVGPVSRRGGSTHSVRDDRSRLQTANALLRSAVDRQLATIGRDLAPYKAIENRTFAVDKSGSDAVKSAMKAALAQVKAGSYKAALEAYISIYEQHKSIAAAENASILHESFGDIKAAVDIMQSAADATGNPRAREVLARLNKIVADQATLAAEYSGGGNQVDRTAAFASAEIQKVLIENARVWIFNNSSAADATMGNAVVDNITADLIRNGIGIVDRDNRDIINAEQMFSMSGSVSDDDILNVGNAAGANMIVVIGVTGTGAMRRLQVRVLDIERGVPVMQSDTGERWQL